MEDKYIGIILALSSSLLIGISFIITKVGLIETARTDGNETQTHSYLKNRIWWLGLITREIANFAAYSFAPAVLVTPLGALSVIIGAILASIFLKEKLNSSGKVGCALCILGSIIIVTHAPEDKSIESIDEILSYALNPGFIIYSFLVLLFSLVMIFHYAPRYGKKHLLIYISICSLVGSITVIACKGFGIALKLTLTGHNQLTHPATYLFALIVIICILTQMNYFNKALDTFSTNLVTPIYYVLFTTAALTASIIFFQGVAQATPVEIVSLIVGFLVIFAGVFLLNHVQREIYEPLSPHSDTEICIQITTPPLSSSEEPSEIMVPMLTRDSTGRVSPPRWAPSPLPPV